jgi:potassium efflux system protein
MRVFSGMLAVVLAGAFFCLSSAHGQTADQKPPAPVSSTTISVPEIAARAMVVSNLLRTLETSLTPSSKIGTIQRLLPKVSKRIDRKLTEVAEILAAQPALNELQAEQQLWQEMELQTSGWLEVLTERAVALSEALNQVADLKETWIKTRDAARASKAPGPVRQQVDEVLAAINSAQPPLEAQRSSVLDLQSRVAREVGRCDTTLARVSGAQHAVIGSIFTRDSTPIWSPELLARAQATLPRRAREVATNCREDISRYVYDPSRGLPLDLGLFMLLTAAFCGMRRHLHHLKEEGEGASSAVTVLDHPYTAALLGSLVAASGPFSETPATVKALFEILAIAPMIRLTWPMIDPRVIPGLFILWALFALDAVRQAFTVAPLVGQVLLASETLVGIGVFGWSLLFGHLRGSAVKATGLDRIRARRVAASLALFILASALIAGVSGYRLLSRILTSEILAGGTTALALYACVRVLGGVVAFALRVWPLRLLRMVMHNRDLLERRAHGLLVWVAVVIWAGSLLDYVGLLQQVLSLGSTILATDLERGSISISVGDIIAFFLTVWIAYLLSAFIRFVLKEDVYPRIGIQRGASYAVASLLNYTILALGFVIALGVIGVNLTKVTVLAGAFGVGIGFGLQSVVNNFVSGLILLFERPIHVGDTVEIGDLLGEVHRIGIRASIVHTWRGSDIIVPNADLISKQVTNWTLGDSLRRIDLDVGINYGAGPKEVISVLESVARAHPDILQDPAPQGLFMSYGDGSIKFQLRAWTDRLEDWPRIRSDLAVAVYDAAREAGMSFPSAQQQVHSLHDTGAQTTSSPVDGAAKDVVNEKQKQ